MAEDLIIWLFFLFVGVGVALGAKKLTLQDVRRWRRARPWLSKYVPYRDDTGLPIVVLHSKTNRPEIWVFRIAGISFAGWSLYNLIDTVV